MVFWGGALVEVAAAAGWVAIGEEGGVSVGCGVAGTVGGVTVCSCATAVGVSCDKGTGDPPAAVSVAMICPDRLVRVSESGSRVDGSEVAEARRLPGIGRLQPAAARTIMKNPIRRRYSSLRIYPPSSCDLAG